MEVMKNRDQYDSPIFKDCDYSNATCESTKWLKLSSGELEEIDLTRIIRMLK